jgi:hypothetical protein
LPAIEFAIQAPRTIPNAVAPTTADQIIATTAVSQIQGAPQNQRTTATSPLGNQHIQTVTPEETVAETSALAETLNQPGADTSAPGATLNQPRATVAAPRGPHKQSNLGAVVGGTVAGIFVILFLLLLIHRYERSQAQKQRFLLFEDDEQVPVHQDRNSVSMKASVSEHYEPLAADGGTAEFGGF